MFTPLPDMKREKGNGFAVTPQSRHRSLIDIITGYDNTTHTQLIALYMAAQKGIKSAKANNTLGVVTVEVKEDDPIEVNKMIGMIYQNLPNVMSVPIKDTQSHIDYYEGKMQNE